MGRICLKLPPSEHHGFKPIPMHSWFPTISVPVVRTLVWESEKVWNTPHVHLQGAVHRQKSQADARHSATPHFQPGQMVWLSTRDIHLQQPYWKLNARIIGPHWLPNKSCHLSLDLPRQYCILPSLHVSLLKPFTNTLPLHPQGLVLGRRLLLPSTPTTRYTALRASWILRFYDVHHS